jgi:hypothetical protein
VDQIIQQHTVVGIVVHPIIPLHQIVVVIVNVVIIVIVVLTAVIVTVIVAVVIVADVNSIKYSW